MSGIDLTRPGVWTELFPQALKLMAHLESQTRQPLCVDSRTFLRNRRRRYAEHLVFGLHCQTFLLFILLAEAKLPTILADAFSFWVLAYFTMALKRVYGGTWIETLGRGFAISGLYFAIIFVMNLLLVFFLLAL